MKLQSHFRRKEKLTNRLVINAAAHQGLAGTTHPPAHPAGHVSRPGLMAEVKEKKKTEGRRKAKQGHGEYLDCAVQIFGAL